MPDRTSARAAYQHSPELEAEALGPELGAEGCLECIDNAVSELAGVLVGEGPLGRLEADREGDRLLAGAHLLASIDVEGSHLSELRARGFPCSSDQLAGGHLVRDREGQVLADRRIGDDIVVNDQVRHELGERVDVQLEGTPLTKEAGVAQSRDPTLVSPRPTTRR